MNNQPFPFYLLGRVLRGTLFLSCLFVRAYAEDVTEIMTTSDGTNRTYLLHTPPCYDGTKPLPLILNLHYGAGTGAGEAAISRMSDKADTECFIVAYPDAIGDWTEYDSLFLSEIIDTLRGHYAIDSLRVYMTGFSAGALMSHWMACKLSGKVAAVAPVAGTMLTYDWYGCYPENAISIISFNARNDILVPYYGDGGYFTPVEKAMSDWAERLGCELGPDTFYNENGALRQTWSRSDSACEVVLWTTEEGGHSWPTDSSYHKLPASDLMWKFFMSHPLVSGKPAVSEPVSTDALLDPLNANVFGRRISVRFSLKYAGSICLRLYDASGRQVAIVKEGMVGAGEHEAVIDASNLSCGVYFYCLSSPHGTQTRNILVVK